MRKDPLARHVAAVVSALLMLAVSASVSRAQQVSVDPVPEVGLNRPVAVPTVPPVATPVVSPLTPSAVSLPNLSTPQSVGSALQIVVLLTVLSLAPAILIMTTSFTRIIIVLSLLRQALGTQQLPPNQILMGLALFMTFLVMGPTWTKINHDAVQPYLHEKLSQEDALDRGRRAAADVHDQPDPAGEQRRGRAASSPTPPTLPPPKKLERTSARFTLIPAFMLSELKTAFYLGFKVYLPFLIVDMVISSVLISMGMMMLPAGR